MSPAPAKSGLSSEVKVGLLFFLGLALMLWFTFFVTQFGTPKGDLSVRFRKVTQLKEGDPVTFNGVRVGTIAAVLPDVAEGVSMVRVQFTIDKKFRKAGAVVVDASSSFRIALGTLGGATLDIRSAGGQPISQEALAAVWGEDGAGLSDAAESVQNLVEENRVAVNRAITAFGQASEQIRDLVQENRDTVKAALAHIDQASDQVAGMIGENRTTVKEALANIRTMSGQIGEMVAENRAEVRAALTALPATVQNVGDAAKRIETLLAENQEDVRKLIQSLASFGPKLDRVGGNLEVITTQIAEGKGTLGKLTMDDTLHDHALQTVDSLDHRLDEVKPLTSGLSQLRLAGYAGGAYNTDTGQGTGWAGLQLEPRPWKFFAVGISYRTAPDGRDIPPDDSDSVPINVDLQVGWRFLKNDDDQTYLLSVSAGALESELGAMTNVTLWGQHLGLTAMVRMKDNNKPVNDREYEKGDAMVRASLEYRPFRDVGLWFIGGVDDLVENPAPWVGMRAVLYDDDFRNLIGLASFGR
jgi:phospholipid/cholesterol/gamma-HCH transport system substrate-binding protein